jgi:DNA-binding MarR family transcriptional regulator
MLCMFPPDQPVATEVRDVVKELGFLTLGTRFRRIGESLQAQAHLVLASNGLDMPAAHFPLLAALDRLGPLSVSDLSKAVGVSQPVVSRSLLGLEASGLVESDRVATDRRVRSVRLSRQGQRLVQHAKREVWPVIEAAVAQACEPLTGPLLDQLAALELALEQTPLLQRAATATATATAPAPAPAPTPTPTPTKRRRTR